MGPFRNGLAGSAPDHVTCGIGTAGEATTAVEFAAKSVGSTRDGAMGLAPDHASSRRAGETALPHARQILLLVGDARAALQVAAQMGFGITAQKHYDEDAGDETTAGSGLAGPLNGTYGSRQDAGPFRDGLADWAPDHVTLGGLVRLATRALARQAAILATSWASACPPWDTRPPLPTLRTRAPAARREAPPPPAPLLVSLPGSSSIA